MLKIHLRCSLLAVVALLTPMTACQLPTFKKPLSRLQNPAPGWPVQAKQDNDVQINPDLFLPALAYARLSVPEGNGVPTFLVLPKTTTWHDITAHLSKNRHWQPEPPPELTYCEVIRRFRMGDPTVGGHRTNENTLEPSLLLDLLQGLDAWVVDGRCRIRWQMFKPISAHDERLVVVFMDAPPGKAADRLMYLKVGDYAD